MTEIRTHLRLEETLVYVTSAGGFTLRKVFYTSRATPDARADRAALADIERGFKVLKSEIEIALVFHRSTACPNASRRMRVFAS